MYRILLAYIMLLVFFKINAQTSTQNDPYSIEKTVFADHAAVVSAHPLASHAGIEIIRQGGNAVDAAITVQLVLAVVYPRAGNIGGGGFMVYRGQDGETNTLDFREKAPAAATRDMYLDAQGNVIPGKSLNGHLAAGIPGTVDGIFKAFAKYSRLKNFSLLIQPAIDLAENGFYITQREADNLNEAKEDFIKYNTHKPVFVKKSPWKKGDLLIQKDLANTLKRIRDQGEAGFYEGVTARKIIREMKSGGGIITLKDLKNYDAVWRKPLKGTYKGYEIITMPPPSSGGVLLLQMLQMLAPYPFGSWGFHSAKAIHLFTEVERRAYADRAKHLGDADFYPVPVDKLLSADYIKNRMVNYEENKATPSSKIDAGDVKMHRESHETTHFSIVDAEGNAVSITTTLNNNFGSKTVVKGAGFILNDEMDDFSVKPGVPNLYGAIGGEANAIQPGKRMLSSMTPTIIARDGKLFMVLGTPGGTTIITSVLQVFLNVSDYGMDMTKAVQARRFHHQWAPDKIFIEKTAFSPEVSTALTEMGHQIEERGAIGLVEAILVGPDGKLEGAADPRGEDDAEGN